MKVLIAKQFNDAMQQLRKREQNEVAAIFSLLSEMESEALMASPILIQLKTDNSLYTIRTQRTRIFCSFVENELVLLDVQPTESSSLPSRATGNSDEMREISLFGALGDPQAYIAESELYSFDGRPLAYIDGSNIYGFNGKHLGWFENGIVWDHQGERVGFTKSSCPVFTKFEPFKGFKQFKPFKAFKQFAPFKPLFRNTNSRIPLLKFLEDGRV